MLSWRTCAWLAALLAATTVQAEVDADYDAAMQTMATRPVVQAALEQVAEIEAGNLPRLFELTGIPAPPLGEAERGGRFAAMLRAAGLERVERDAVGNVIGHWLGDGRPETLAVVAHMDTVFPAGTDLAVREMPADAAGPRRYYAPGIGDNARGLVLLLTLVESMARAGVQTRRNVLFVGSVGEEGVGDLRGMKHLLRQGGPRIDELLAIDGGNDLKVLNGAIGSQRYRIVIRGPGGHSWGAFGLANPAHALASAIHLFDQEASLLVRDGPRSTYNIGRLGGGTSVNAVPHESWADVDLRSADAARLEELDRLLKDSVAQATSRHNAGRSLGEALEAEFAVIGSRPSGVVEPQAALVQQALAAARYLGLSPSLGAGSTDANVAIARGIPAATISRGGVGGGAHSLDEWWSPAGVEVGARKALLVVLAAAGVAR